MKICNENRKDFITPSTRDEVEYINKKIVEFNADKVPFTQEKPFVNLNFSVKDTEGNIIAGVSSTLYCWGCLYIDLLWVEETYRKNGYGSMLLAELEQMAKEQGGNISHLDTFDFQARDFYLNNGYEVFGVLEDCPTNHHRYYLKKML